jgi:hypothetical protein
LRQVSVELFFIISPRAFLHLFSKKEEWEEEGVKLTLQRMDFRVQKAIIDKGTHTFMPEKSCSCAVRGLLSRLKYVSLSFICNASPMATQDLGPVFWVRERVKKWRKKKDLPRNSNTRQESSNLVLTSTTSGSVLTYFQYTLQPINASRVKIGAQGC